MDEKEVLFMTRSVFKINSANPFDSIHVWIIELELCNNAAYELNPVYEKDIYIYERIARFWYDWRLECIFLITRILINQNV